MKIAKMEVTLVDKMGSDLSVVNAARVSFHKKSHWEYTETDPTHGGKTFDDAHLSGADQKLIKYLAKHGHWSPFAHAFVSLRIKAPIFVARQLVKHQVGLSWNEVSRRYVDDEPEFFIPIEWRGKPENSKQGSSGVIKLPDENDDYYVESTLNASFNLYEYLLNVGVAPEQARMVLPQNTMTEWIWSGSLMAFARVCKQRLDPHAQQETQEVAMKIAAIIEPLFPVSWMELCIQS